jgi:hypothetical protein
MDEVPPFSFWRGKCQVARDFCRCKISEIKNKQLKKAQQARAIPGDTSPAPANPSSAASSAMIKKANDQINTAGLPSSPGPKRYFFEATWEARPSR